MLDSYEKNMDKDGKEGSARSAKAATYGGQI
jgi:hypothetical protein